MLKGEGSEGDNLTLSCNATERIEVTKAGYGEIEEDAQDICVKGEDQPLNITKGCRSPITLFEAQNRFD
jgi:hypothetical protein